jgi:hypothetical protein
MADLTLQQLEAEQQRRQQQKPQGKDPELERLEAEQERRHPSIAKDLPPSIAQGVREGTEGLVGAPGALARLPSEALMYVMKKMGILDPETEQEMRTAKAPFDVASPTPGELNELYSKVTDTPNYESKTQEGEWGRTAGAFGVGAVIGPGGVMSKALQTAIPTAAHEITKQFTDSKILPEIAAMIASLRTPGYHGAPQKLDPSVRTLTEHGVPMTAGQEGGSRALKYAESEIGGGGYARQIDQQKEAFTHAIMEDLGAPPGTLATPENLVIQRQRIGGDMNNLAAQTNIPLDQTLTADLARTAANYTSQTAHVAPIVQETVADVARLAAANGGRLTGQNYQALTTRIREMADGADPTTQMALNNLRNNLDDAVERSMSPELLDQWRHSRGQYRSLMTTERAVAGSTEDAALGLVSPTQLSTAIRSNEGFVSAAEGRNRLQPLADAGNAALKTMPQSGTATRTATRVIPGALAGATAAAATGANVLPTLGATGLAIAAPAVVGHMLMRPDVQWALKQQYRPQSAAVRASLGAGKAAAVLPETGDSIGEGRDFLTRMIAEAKQKWGAQP